jgi:aspartate kinase
MHERAIQFGKKYNVVIHVRSSFTDNPGTIITNEVETMEGIVVQAVTVRKDLAQFVLPQLPNSPGVIADIFGRVARQNIIVDDIMQTFDNQGHVTTSFIVLHQDLAETRMVTDEIRREYQLPEVICYENIAKVSVVGVGMRSYYGVAYKMFQALADAHINILAITTSEIKISCIIEPADADRAVQAVHAAFELDKINGNS